MLKKLLMLMRRRKGLFVPVSVSVALLISAFIVGVGDNVPGLVLCYLAVAVLFVALVRNWRDLKKFLILMGASFAGFFVSVLLHNLLYGLIMVKLLGRPDLDEPFFFLVAVLICPVGFLIGAAGSAVIFLKRRRTK